jgi:hypothetical protein
LWRKLCRTFILYTCTHRSMLLLLLLLLHRLTLTACGVSCGRVPPTQHSSRP